MHAKSIGGILTWLALTTPLIAQTPVAPSPLVGTSWRLVKFEGGDGKVMRPPNPDSFTLEFLHGDGLSLRVDCNRGRGTWKASPPSGIELKPQVLTRAFCGQESMHDQILKHLPLVRSYVMKNDRLFLSLMADGGIYEYERAKPAAGQSAMKSPVPVVGSASFQCDGNPATVKATFYKTQPGLAVLQRESETRVAFQVVSASGARYVGDGVEFWEAGGAATINWAGTAQKCRRLP